RGYRTGAFVAAFVLDSKFGLNRGFETYDEDLSHAVPQAVHERLSVYRPGNQVVDAALGWLEKAAAGPAPFFCWVHLYDPHYPDFAHDELAGTPFEGKASYDAEVAFMDRQVGRLAAFLETRQLAGRTLVVAVADHGEGLGDHGEIEHGYLLNEEVLRVPLLVAFPGVVRAGARVDAMVSIVDLAPTVLEVLGIPAPARFSGRSLLPALSDGQRRQLASLGYVGGGQSADPASAQGALKDIKDMLAVKQLDTRLRRGTSFETLRQDEILEIGGELVRRSPETPDFHSRLGAALLDAGRLDEAGKRLTEALRLDPEQVDAHVNLGRVLARQDKLEQAIRHFEE